MNAPRNKQIDKQQRRMGFYALCSAAALLAAANSASADFFWNSTVAASWSVNTNWQTPLPPTGGPSTAGDVDWINTNITAGRNVNLFVTGDPGTAVKTLGTLNIGDTDGSNAFTVAPGSGGGSLSFNNNGNGAQINELSTGKLDIISAPVVIADSNSTAALTVTNNGQGNFSLSGGITGTGNLVFNNNNSGTANLVVSTLVNNAGTIVSSGTGTGTGALNITGGVGGNVTTVTNNSTQKFSITGLAVNSGGTTVINNTANQITISSTVTGTGDLILQNDSTLSSGINFTGAVNNSGAITNSGPGSGTVNFASAGSIGSNVTAINQNSANSPLTLNGAITVAAGGTTITNTGGALLSTGTSATITGAGNLTLQNNSATASAITTGELVNNAGTITNNGTGSQVLVNNGVGSNVTSITQNSATSILLLKTAPITVNSSGTTLINNYSGGSGGAQLQVANANGTNLTDTAGTGDLILQNNSAIAGGITFQNNPLGHTGAVINSGTGTGTTVITAAIGSTITGVSQNSATSPLVLASTANLYTGLTSVLNGLLVLDGQLAAGSSVNVGNPSTPSLSPTLGGGIGAANGGSINVSTHTYTHSTTIGNALGAVTISAPVGGSAGHLAPGNSVGTLSVGSLSLNSGAILDYEFNSTTPSNDLTYVDGTGALAIGSGSGNVGFNLYQEGTLTAFAADGTYQLIRYDPTVTISGDGIGSLVVLNQDPAHTYNFTTTTIGADNFVTLNIGDSMGTVPEPASLAMLGLGALTLLARGGGNSADFPPMPPYRAYRPVADSAALCDCPPKPSNYHSPPPLLYNDILPQPGSTAAQCGGFIFRKGPS